MPKNIKHLVIEPDKSTECDCPLTLDYIQKVVGGYFEVVKCKNREYILLVNEDGRRLGLAPNVEATDLVPDMMGLPIVGSAIYVKGKDFANDDSEY